MHIFDSDRLMPFYCLLLSFASLHSLFSCTVYIFFSVGRQIKIGFTIMYLYKRYNNKVPLYPYMGMLHLWCYHPPTRMILVFSILSPENCLKKSEPVFRKLSEYVIWVGKLRNRQIFSYLIKRQCIPFSNSFHLISTKDIVEII